MAITSPRHPSSLHLAGPDSGKPGGAVAGLPIADLLAAWAKPFSSSVPADGGCAPLDYTMFKK